MGPSRIVGYDFCCASSKASEDGYARPVNSTKEHNMASEYTTIYQTDTGAQDNPSATRVDSVVWHVASSLPGRPIHLGNQGTMHICR